MLTRRQTLGLLGMLPVAGGALAGPRRARAQAAPPRGGTLKMIAREPLVLNNGIQSGIHAGMPGCQLFAGLVQLDDKFQPRPYLAEKWEVSKDHRTFTFHLVRGATFHDGKPVTADDVKFSIEMVKAYHTFGGPMFRAVEAVDTPSPTTVVVRLAYPYPSFLPSVHPVTLPVVPRHVFGDGKEIKKHPANTRPIGSGPFKFVDWKRGTALTLERYDGFFRKGRPYLDRLIFEYISDPATRANAMETGEANYTPFGYVSIADAKRLAQLPTLALTTKGYGGVGWVVYVNVNQRHEKLKHLKVRQAIAHAIDRDFIVSEILSGFGKPLWSPIHSSSPYHNPDVPKYPYSLERANQLLDEAGFKRGADGTRFPLTVDAGTNTVEIQTHTTEYLVAQLKKIGIAATHRPSPDFPTFASRMGSWNYEICLDSSYNMPDPVIGVERMWVSSNIKKAVYTNTAGYSNPEVDQAFAAAQRTPDAKERKALYGKAQHQIATDLPCIFVVEPTYYTLYNRELVGLPEDVHGPQNPYDGVSSRKGKGA
jgi:peptide/nickel transport system substrate-binding protein